MILYMYIYTEDMAAFPCLASLLRGRLRAAAPLGAAAQGLAGRGHAGHHAGHGAQRPPFPGAGPGLAGHAGPQVTGFFSGMGMNYQL